VLSALAVEKNQELEFERNKERFLFLKVVMSLFVTVVVIIYSLNTKR